MLKITRAPNLIQSGLCYLELDGRQVGTVYAFAGCYDRIREALEEREATPEEGYLLEEQGREIAALVKRLANAELLIERLKREVKELNFSVALHDRSVEKARAIWEEEHPDAEFMPGRTDLMVWLTERVERAEAVKESLTSALRDIKKNVDDWNLQDYVTIRRLVNAALRTAEETNHGTHDRPAETLLLIKELGRMSNKLDALKGSLRNIADNAAHWDTGCGPDASAFGWIHDIAEAALRTAEDSSVVDGTHAKQPEDSANTDGDGDILNDIETSLRAKTDGMKRLLESQTLSPELAALGRELVRLAEKSLEEVEE